MQLINRLLNISTFSIVALTWIIATSLLVHGYIDLSSTKDQLDLQQIARDPQTTAQVILVKNRNRTSTDSLARLENSIEAFKLNSTSIIEDESESNEEEKTISKIRKHLEQFKQDNHKIIILTLDDRVIINADQDQFKQRLANISNAHGSRLLIPSQNNGQPNINALVAMAPTLWELMNEHNLSSSYEDSNDIGKGDIRMLIQTCSHDEECQRRLNLRLDNKSQLFQCVNDLDGLENKLKLVDDGDMFRLENSATLTEPIIVVPSDHFEFPSNNMLLNSIGNYLGKAWTQSQGSRQLSLSLSEESDLEDDRKPVILIGIFVVQPTPFLDHFFELILNLNYPKDKIHLFLFNSIAFHKSQVDTFKMRLNSRNYASLRLITTTRRKEEKISDELGQKVLEPKKQLALDLEAELEARSIAMEHCHQLRQTSRCDYYLYLNSLARLTNDETLNELLKVKKRFVGPLLSRPNRLWSNFWAWQTKDRFYARSFDYVDLIKGEKRGLWAVALIQNVYLIEASFIDEALNRGVVKYGLLQRLKQGKHELRGSTNINNNNNNNNNNSITMRHKRTNLATNKLNIGAHRINALSDMMMVSVDHRHKINNESYTGKSAHDPIIDDGNDFVHSEGHQGEELVLEFIDPMQVNRNINNIEHKDYVEIINQARVSFALEMADQLNEMGVFQYLLNTHHFGHLVDETNYKINLTKPDFYQLGNNQIDWEREYLHENYSKITENDDKDIVLSELSQVFPNKWIEEPCQDVFWFPLVSESFNRDLLAIMENFGQWSSGQNDDPRIEGGYESVPTRDIHFRQVGLHSMWLNFLRLYVAPIQLRQFIGYEHDPPRADLAFVVRYNPAEQAFLRPHHDSATYTLNIALNAPGQDYEGGGCRFVRQNCSVTQSRPGWALMHPGRLTHYHEGLPVTRGTRYILVTFVDP